MSTKKEKKKLIIVESPTKAKTIARFLGDDFLIESSQGHIRDLPKGKLGIDVENNFTAQYVTPTIKKKIVSKLKKLAEKSDEIYFATDEDREGEAIAWHLSQLLPTENKIIRRIAFHEITENAIKESLKNPREIDFNLFQAQQARRILDRLVGYKLSPLLWKKIFKGLSAGRVQSPTLRLIVEREKEIEKFKPKEYWSIKAILKNDEEEFEAKLVKINGKNLEKLSINSKDETEKLIRDLEQANYEIEKIKNKQLNKRSLPPFTTSTLQQEANKKLGFSVKQTMMIAQQLYEGISLTNKNTGLITYMRTDSLNLSYQFLNEAENLITKEFGKKYHHLQTYKTKSKSAQEAHEAIRPTFCENNPEKIASFLNKNQWKLYNLIWQRAIASQMADEILDSTTIEIKANYIKDKSEYELRASGLKINFDGWIKIYPEKQQENYLPKLEEKQKLNLKSIEPNQHFTEPPPRYNEATLVKTLEEYGIGRPSTYAPIISTIQNRNYAIKQQRSFIPTETGILVNNLLSEHFHQIVDYQFTAQMENDLDKIAQGEGDYLKMLNDFYQPFIKNLKMKEEQIQKNFNDEKTEEKCPECGEPLVIKTGRFGKFLACTGFPKCHYTKSLGDLKGNPNSQEIGIPCPKCQGEIVKKKTKKGKFFFGCSKWPKCDFAVWDEPVAEKCPKCRSIMVKKKDSIQCSNKDCK